MQQPPDRSPAPPSLDLMRLQEISGGDAAFEVELLDEFERSTADLMKKLSEAVAAGDANALARTAHALKGSARTIGADPLGAVCHEIEQAARGGSAAESSRLAQAAREFERVRQEIAKVRRARAA